MFSSSMIEKTQKIPRLRSRVLPFPSISAYALLCRAEKLQRDIFTYLRSDARVIRDPFVRFTNPMVNKNLLVVGW